jgi:exonuclease III
MLRKFSTYISRSNQAMDRLYENYMTQGIFGTWNVRSLYRAGSLKTVARKLEKYIPKLDLLGVQEVRWEKEGTARAEEYTFIYGKDNEDQQLGICFFSH